MACITKRRGRYVIDCYDQHGKRYRKTLPAGTTKEAARKELAEIEKRIDRCTFIHEKKTPLFSQVAQDWLKHKKPNIRETTYENNQQVIRTHLVMFNDMKISSITIATIEKFFSYLQETGLKIATMRRIINVVNQIMSYAVRHRLIDSNPVRDAERPRRTVNDEDDRVIQVIPPEKIKDFLNAVDDPKYRMMFLVAVMTGARQGELLGLKWSDVDFDKKQIHISRTYNHGRFFSPKTKQSRRSIDLAPIIIKELRKWKLMSKPNEHDLVFPDHKGNPMTCNGYVHRPFHAAIKKAGLFKMRFHDLRHTYASLLIQQGENIKYIQTQLGHATPMMTLNVYSHLMKSENQEAVLRLENTVFSESGHNLVTNRG
jgi:integrase